MTLLMLANFVVDSANLSVELGGVDVVISDPVANKKDIDGSNL